MNRFTTLIAETIVVAAIAATFGYVCNARNPKGIALEKDNLLTSVRSLDQDTATRIQALGLQTISHDDVVKDFDDELYQKYEAYAFVDARNDANYADGHIPGAWHFDPYHVDSYTKTVVPQCQSSAKVIVYCNGGQCVDSELAAQHLVNLGVSKETLFVYVGGIQAWKKAKRSVEKGERKSGQLVLEKPDDG